MSGEAPLVQPITGYIITVINEETPDGDVILEQRLSLNKVGGAHITNADDLVMMIEDAVFQKEESRD